MSPVESLGDARLPSRRDLGIPFLFQIQSEKNESFSPLFDRYRNNRVCLQRWRDEIGVCREQ